MEDTATGANAQLPEASEDFDVTLDYDPFAPKDVVVNELCPVHTYPSCPLPSYILKIPKPKASGATGTPECGPPTPAESAVSLEYLRAFIRRLPDGSSTGMSWARVVDEVIKPATAGTYTSYASQSYLVPRGHTSRPTWVVINPWDMSAAETLAALEDFAAGLPPRSTYFWLDALAVSHHTQRPGTTLAAGQPPQGADGGAAEGGAGADSTANSTSGGTGGAADPAPAPAGASPAPSRALTTMTSFATELRKQHAALAAAAAAEAMAVRREALEGARAAVRAARCGVLLMVGREVRPLRRGWCLVQAAEALRALGPEAVTLLPVEKTFRRVDLVRQLRELDPAAAVAAADAPEQQALAAALGVPVPPPSAPRSRATSPAPGDATAAAAAAAAAPTDGGADGDGGNGHRALGSGERGSRKYARHPSGPATSRRASLGRSGSHAGEFVDCDPGHDDGSAGGRALVRQLQLALLLRPLDGVLPARMLGAALVDANPVATTTTSKATATTTAASTIAAAAPATSALAPPASFPWLWDWSPIAAWLSLPPQHPHWPCMLLTSPPGAGKTTALASLLASPTHGSAIAAAHFCSAADARSLAPGEVVRSLAYQLACRSPCFGAALCRGLLSLGGGGGGGHHGGGGGGAGAAAGAGHAGGAAGSAGWVPDVWLHGIEDVVEMLLKRPMQLEAEALTMRGEPLATYVLLIDGLDEGPVAAAAAEAAATALPPGSSTLQPPLSSDGRAVQAAAVGTVTTHGSPAPAGPSAYGVVRLVLRHLRHLPGVRLILSCSTPAEEEPDPHSAAAAAVMPPPPLTQDAVPHALIAAPQGAGEASWSVALALRRALLPREVALGCVRRDKYLPLALAHQLQEFVLSPELTAKELLWQARGCLAHAGLLALLVRHAAEQLGPEAELLDGSRAAAATAAAPEAPPGPSAAAVVVLAVGQEAGPGRADEDAEVAKAPGAGGAEGAARTAAGAAAGGEEDDLPPRPQTPPPRSPVQRQTSRQASEGQAEAAEDGAEATPAIQDGVGAGGSGGVSGWAAPAAETQQSAPPSPQLPLGVETSGAPHSGEGPVGVHAVPPVSRGSLSDEYGVLWAVRTAPLLQEALLALVRSAEAECAAALAEAEPSSSARALSAAVSVVGGRDTGGIGGAAGGGGAVLRRSETLTLREPPPLPPPHPPDRAARLQVLLDVLAAAREPLDWATLARAVQAAEPPSVAAAAAAAAAGWPGWLGGLPSVSEDREEEGGTPSEAGGERWGGLGGLGGLDGWPLAQAASGGDSALVDLEWALQEGPLSGLLWITGSGKVALRHSSFQDWLRAASVASPPPPASSALPSLASRPATATDAAVAAAAAVAPALLGPPRPLRGHAALARALRQQLISQVAAATAADAAGSPPPSSQQQQRSGGTSSGAVASSRPSTQVGPAAAAAAGGSRSGARSPAAGNYSRRAGTATGDGSGGGGSYVRAPASGYCLRHVLVHCAEGRLTAAELEAMVVDLDYWRQVFEWGHVEVTASGVEHALHRAAAPPVDAAALAAAILRGLTPPPLPPRTPPAGAAAAAVRGSASAAGSPAANVAPPAGASLTPVPPYPACGDGVGSRGGSRGGGGSVGWARSSRPGRPCGRISAAAAGLLREARSWLLRFGPRLSRRPDPLAVLCAAASAPLPSPFRRVSEQLVVAAVVAASTPGYVSRVLASAPGNAASASRGSPHVRALSPLFGLSTARLADSLRPSHGSAAGSVRSATGAGGGPSVGGTGNGDARGGGGGSGDGAAAGPREPAVYPPCYVTALPHPRAWSPGLRVSEVSHRISGLLPSPDGEVVLAAADWTPQASVIDAHSGRTSTLLDAGADAHHAALSAAAFSPDRRFLAAAGASAGSVALWDPAAGAPRLLLHLDPAKDTDPCVSRSEAAGPRLPAQPAAGGDSRAQRRESQASASSAAYGLRTFTSDGAFADAGEPWVTCIRLHDPGPAAFATAYGAAPGTPIVTRGSVAVSADDVTEPRVAGGIPAGSVLLAAGGSGSGRVVLWAVARDGGSAIRTAELSPPEGADSRGGVACLEFLPGGRSLVVVQGCSTLLRVWNVASRSVTASLRLPAAAGEIFALRLPPHTAQAHCIADGGGEETLFAAVCTKSTQLWSLERRRQVASLPFGAGAEGGRAWAESCVAFSPAGGLLATAGALLLPAAMAGSAAPSMSGDVRSSSGGGGRGIGSPAAATPPAGAARDPLVDALMETAAATAAAEGNYDRAGATLWDARTGARVSQLRKMPGPVRGLAFSPDGALLAAAAGTSVVLWSAAVSSCLAVLPLGADVTEAPAVAFARGGATLLAAGLRSVHSWDVGLAVTAAAAADGGSGATNRSYAGTLSGSADPFTGSTSGSVGGSVVGGGAGRRSGNAAAAMAAAEAAGGHTDRVAAACFSPDSNLVLTGGHDDTVRLWDARRHLELVCLELPAAIMGLAWSPDGNLVALALSNGAAIVWLAAAAAEAPQSAAAREAFALPVEEARFECSDGTLAVAAVSFSADGALLLTAIGDGSAVLFATNGWTKVGKVVPEWRSPAAAGLTSAVVGAAAAGITASATGDGGGGTSTGTGDGAGGHGAMSGLLNRYTGAAISADGAWVFLGYGREVVMWSVRAKREAAERLGPHHGLVAAVAASPCGKHVAVAAGGSVAVWGKPGADGGGGAAAVGTPTSQARGGGGAFGSGKPAAPFGSRLVQLSCAAEVCCLAFSRDGLLLAAGCGDGCVGVWEAETGRWREVAWLAGHGGAAVCCVTFSPDCRVLLSTGADGRCLAWSTRDVVAPRSTWSSGA